MTASTCVRRKLSFGCRITRHVRGGGYNNFVVQSEATGTISATQFTVKQLLSSLIGSGRWCRNAWRALLAQRVTLALLSIHLIRHQAHSRLGAGRLWRLDVNDYRFQELPFLGEDVDFSTAKPAGGSDAQVFSGESQFLLAVGAF